MPDLRERHGACKNGKVLPEYTLWLALKTRCGNPRCSAYRYYGGRGIKVCDRWVDSFQNFLSDMGARPSAEHCLSRIERDGDYEPVNCKWMLNPYRGRHRQYKSPEYHAWFHMKARCLNPKNQRYAAYGERGISVCEQWMTFDNFLADMGCRPSPDHSLDRINNDGNYEPGNCRWATRSQQQRNKRK